MIVTVLSVAEATFRDAKNGNTRTYYKLYVAASDGRVGVVNSSKKHAQGEKVTLGLSVDNNGRLVVRVDDQKAV